MKEIRIEKLNITLRHISPKIANDLIHGLPKKMFDEIIKQSTLKYGNNKIFKISEIDLGVLKCRRNPDPSYLQNLIANQIGKGLSHSNVETKHVNAHYRTGEAE